MYGGTGYASALGQGIEDEGGRGRGGLVTRGLGQTTLDQALKGSYKHTTDDARNTCYHSHDTYLQLHWQRVCPWLFSRPTPINIH